MKNIILLFAFILGLFLSSCVTSGGISERDPFVPESIKRQQQMNRRNNTPNSTSNNKLSKAYYKKAAKKAKKEACYTKASGRSKTPNKAYYKALAKRNNYYGPFVHKNVVKNQKRK